MTEILPTEREAEVAYEVEANIRAVVTEMRKGWLILARELHRFHDLKMWRALGYRSFEEWCASPDIDIKRRTVYGLIEVWQQLVVDRGVDPAQLEGCNVSTVREVLPAVRRGQVPVEEALADVRSLSRNDIRERYDRAPATSGPDTSTRYDAEAEREFAICPTCGSRYEVRS